MMAERVGAAVEATAVVAAWATVAAWAWAAARVVDVAASQAGEGAARVAAAGDATAAMVAAAVPMVPRGSLAHAETG